MITQDRQHAGPAYLAFSRSHDLDAAIARFVEKFGHEPAEHYVIGVDLHLGPVGVAPQETEPAPEGEQADPVQRRLL